jgi:3-oxoadipate enol-lactonase
MPMLETPDATLHVEIDGEGEPVTVLAHGLTNTCRELAAFTPMVPGTKVRFCFRGHGHSSVPERGYRFADFARDLDAVASAYGATRVVGTSLGAGAVLHLLGSDPDRFERIVLLLPAGLDRPPRNTQWFMRVADLLETLPREQAIEEILAGSGRAEVYSRQPWIRDFDAAMWEDMNPSGAARAIRGVVQDRPLADRELLRAVRARTLVIAREGDAIHPAELARTLAELLPNAELVMFSDDAQMLERVPETVARVAAVLTDP